MADQSIETPPFVQHTLVVVIFHPNYSSELSCLLLRMIMLYMQVSSFHRHHPIFSSVVLHIPSSLFIILLLDALLEDDKRHTENYGY